MSDPKTMAEFLRLEKQRREASRIREQQQKDRDVQQAKEMQEVAAALPGIFQQMVVELDKSVQDYNSANLGSRITIEKANQNAWVGRFFIEDELHGDLNVSWDIHTRSISYAVDGSRLRKPLTARKSAAASKSIWAAILCLPRA